MSGIYVAFIANYLADRTIEISYGGGVATKMLTLSTPQGAVLSPFLWNIFIDPLLNKILLNHPEVQVHAWADDVIISFTFDTSFLERAKTRLNKLSETIHHWATENKATFAPKKSKIVCFRFPRKPSIDMSISSHIGPIEEVSEIDFLGVTFDDTLSFKTH